MLTELIGITGMNMNAINDGVHIMYHRKSDNSVLAVKPANWVSLQNDGEIADGVLVIQGGKYLVVAPTESSSALSWSSSKVLINTQIQDRLTAISDFEGKSNTAAILANSTIGGDGVGYAPGFCAAYSRANANGKGLTAGKWWLPSMGELLMIFSNYYKINYCLDMISGAKRLSANYLWSSTEHAATGAWTENNGDFYCYGADKVISKNFVRPVSAFIA